MPSRKKSIDTYLSQAVAVSLQVEAGADLADPAVIDLLNSLVGTFDPLVLTGGNARDLLSAADETPRPLLSYINGLGGDDVLLGGDRTADVIVGGDGKDAAIGDGGRDAVFGSAGDDILDGGRDNDLLFGGSDNDVLSGGRNRDTLDGGSGNDVLDGGSGRDELNGGTGIDTITGGSGRDRVILTDQAFESAAVVNGDGLRQVENTPDILTDWSVSEDIFVFDTEVFSVTGNRRVSVSNAADIAEGANIIVLQDTDNDANAATAFNAGAAANLIAANVDVDGAGFFVYWNSALGINRLVYSENLNDAAADIRVLANIDTLKGADAIAALDDFSGGNFAFL